MATVFLLGPTEPKGPAQTAKPHMAVRRRLLAILRSLGHHTILMEDVPPAAGDEDLIEKFDRILNDDRPDAVLVYWPARAKMQTTFDELLLLRKRSETSRLPRIFVLHQEGVAKISSNEFRILESGGRSRYLEAIRRIVLTPVVWRDQAHLESLVDLIGRTELFPR